MRQVVIRGVLVGVGFLLLASAGAKGFDLKETRDTLRGLTGVHVLVEDMNTDTQQAELTKNQIQTDIELRLRNAGIRVLEKEEVSSTPGRPWLYVRMLTAKTTAGPQLYAYMLNADLLQLVHLTRDPDIVAFASTWSYLGETGIIVPPIARSMRERVADVIDQFINAYLAVNPEQAGLTLPRESPQPSAQASMIRQAQERLAGKGFNPGPLDGQMGAKMQAALRQFQRASGLPPTGGLDAATRAALGLE